MTTALAFTEEVANALAENQPVVSMESTLIAQGLPYPQNVEVATVMEKSVRENGAVPATVAIINGRIHVGLSSDQLEWIATRPKDQLMRCSRRSLPQAVAQKASGSTTVSGTMYVSQLAGIPIMTTGGIGGVHRNAPFDISSDLIELGRTAVTVVCSGAKPFLDLHATRETLETQGVLVVGLKTDDFAPFFDKHSGIHCDLTADSARDVSQLIKASHELKMGSGLLVTVPVPEQYRFNYDLLEQTFTAAIADMENAGVQGGDVTTWMIKRLAQMLGEDSVLGNIELLIFNATMAAQIATGLHNLSNDRASDERSGSNPH